MQLCETSEVTPYRLILHKFVNSSKWALFGLGGSNFSDVVVTWLNQDQIGHFSDRYLLPNKQLLLDSETNWIPLDAFYKDEFFVFKFKRFIKVSCKSNSNEDLNIEPGTIQLVFATGNNLVPDVIDNLNRVEITLLNEKDAPFSCPIIAPKQELNSTPTDIYTNTFELIPGVYKLFWNYTDKDLIAEIHCKTNGWVGFGLSPNGGMDKSDVIIGWISNGQVNFTDRHIVQKQVLIDQKQDWILLGSSEKNGINIFKFKRNINLCDEEDLKIDAGSPNVIFAYGENDPQPGMDITYHGTKRGTVKINLISSTEEIVSTPEPDTEIIDFNIKNLILPKVETTYYCKGFQIPKNLTQKRHVYKYEFILPDINFKNMHHALLYECVPGYFGETFEDGDCYTNGEKAQFCQAISIGWAVGGQTIFLYPKDTAYPIGGDTDYSYIVLELHYDNPEMELGYVDKVTLRYYMTKNLRKNELGVLTVGTASTPFGIVIPPKAEQQSIKSYCFNDCLNKKLSTQSLTIISSLPHTHLTGRAVSTKIIRNGKDIGYLFRNKYYDFNYQNTYLLNPTVQITSDDELITECIYSTKDRTKFTYGGMGTRQEMCFQFLAYYPRRNDFKGCISFPAYEDVRSLLLELNKTENIDLSSLNTNDQPEYFQDFSNAFSTLKNQESENVRQLFTTFYNATRVRFACGEFEKKIFNQTKLINQYIEEDQCKETVTSKITVETFAKKIANFFVSVYNFLRKFF
ncbi:unnamed protein product [Brachionus calyciflorus]|uniref:DOMON domain-containing protein n=1 Tax=Brachionus calyciflorus TaxID=104777 RepID=A0A814CSN9_9BILA|nr:unnamed protein product [Brachionus calyciflorus]